MSPGTIFIKTLMSNLQQSKESNSGFIAIPMAEHVISEPTRNSCWECNFSEQFPISSVDSRVNIATVIIGPPHVDYKIITHLKNQKMDGESTLISNKSVLIATLTFVEGVANGPCTIFDENGVLFFEGSFVNGYRQGKGKEYDENGTIVYEGLYDKGKKLVKMIEMEGYWKEYDDNMNLRSVCKKDDEGKNDGVCFYYENGEVKRLSEWHEGNETPYTGYFKLYDERNRKWIEGEYKNGVCNGVIKEYDINGSMISECLYSNGIKLNVVRLSEMAGYWKEYDENGNLKSICKIDDCGRYEGICYFYETGKVKRISEWLNGREYSLMGSIKFYDVAQRKWIDGFYNGNTILNKFPMAEMAGYWKEFDDNGNLTHICEIDDNGNYNGICYTFENGNLQAICRWEEGRVVPYNGYYKVYNAAQNQWIEGYYGNDKQLNMVRLNEMAGYWKEYDDYGNLKSICKKDSEGRYEGVCYFYENGTVTKISEWHEGKEVSLSGRCKFYDEPHKVWYEGGFRNGLREGECTEYDKNGDVIFEGYYKSGNKLYPIPNKKQFWEERDSNGNLCRISQFDADVKYNGLSYQYHNNQITRVSRWEDDKEIETMKLFNNGIMTEYINGKKRYEGEYNDSIESNYQREGEGEEYDNDGVTLLYKGSFKNGKRNGQGILYQYGNIVYDGEWIRGVQKLNYVIYVAIALTLMLLFSIFCFCFGSAYFGTILLGMCITVICYHFNIYAGYIAAGLLFVMIGFFINLYFGIMASGLFFTYLLYMKAKNNKWKKEVVLYGAGIIMFLSLIICLIILVFQNPSLVYLLIFAIGFYFIYLLFVIAHYRRWNTIDFILCAGAILFTCLIISIILASSNNQISEYFLLFSIGFYLVYDMFMFAHIYKWNKNIAYSSSGIILSTCVYICLNMSLGYTKYIKYGYIVVGGVIVTFIVYLIMAYKQKESKYILIGAAIVMGSTLLICVILLIIDFPIVIYILIAIILVVVAVSIIEDKGCENGWRIIWFYYPITILIMLIIAAIFSDFFRYIIILYLGLWGSLYWLIKDYDSEKWKLFPALLCIVETVCTIICLIFGAKKYKFFLDLLSTLLSIGFFVLCITACIFNCSD